MIGGHVLHSGPTQEPHAVELTAIEHHLQETRVVGRGTHAAGTTGVVLLRHSHVEQARWGLRRWIDGKWLREAIELVLRDDERGVFHTERHEDALIQEFTERLAGYRLDHTTQHIDRQAVLERRSPADARAAL
jgi:hypothetical protein